MNDRVKQVIDGLFEGKQMNQQALELRDELLDSANQRFEDDLAEGFSEEAALERIVGSLGDVDELLKDYAREYAEAHEDSGIEARYDASKISAVHVGLTSLGLALEPIDGDELMIAFEGPAEDFENVRYHLTDGVLKVKQKSAILFGLFDLFHWPKHSKVRIGVPATALLNYRLDCVAGGISSNVDVRDAKVQTVSGSIRVNPASTRAGGQLVVSCQSGGVTIGGRYDLAKVDVVSGHVTFDGACESLRVHSTSGSQTVRGQFGRIDMQVVSGKVNVDGAFAEAKFESTSGPMHVRCVNAPESIKAHMVSGSLNLELPGDIDGFVAKHSAISGRLHNEFGANPYGNGHTRIAVDAISGPLRITRGLAAKRG